MAKIKPGKNFNDRRNYVFYSLSDNNISYVPKINLREKYYSNIFFVLEKPKKNSLIKDISFSIIQKKKTLNIDKNNFQNRISCRTKKSENVSITYYVNSLA